MSLRNHINHTKKAERVNRKWGKAVKLRATLLPPTRLYTLKVTFPSGTTSGRTRVQVQELLGYGLLSKIPTSELHPHAGDYVSSEAFCDFYFKSGGGTFF